MKVINSNLQKIFSILRREGLGGVFLRISNRIRVLLPVKVSPYTVMKVYEDLLSRAKGEKMDDFVPRAETNLHLSEIPIKLITFYLPQYHPIPENDQWWGKGFTEWSNVSKALPQFVGHYQPHLPGDLGFYDLRVPEIQKQQIELARQYGIYGFAFYYYWFNGKRLLERPLDLFLASDEDFPFCLCWANENWTRRWDGQESEILIAQEHSAESDLRFIEDIAPILRDKRYIRINGRPLLIVYRANILPDISKTVTLWRAYCKEQGIEDPYLVSAQTFWFMDPREVDFDAAIEFPPHSIPVTDVRHRVEISNQNYEGHVIDYKEVIEKTSSLVRPDYQLFKTIFPSWDNEARKPGKGYTFINSTPQLYQEWLLQAAKFTLRETDPEKRLLFINAWNEWAEGAHLEPDRRYGYAYLQATADALRKIVDPTYLSEEKGDASFGGELISDQERKKAVVSISDVPIIIFQPGKVGSTSVHASLERKYQELGISVPIYHAHILENISQRIEFVTKERKNPASTIKKLRESMSLRNQIDSDPQKNWNVISLVRDPVAQKVSALFQLIDEYIPNWEQQFKSGEISLEYMQQILLEKEEFEVDRLDAWFDTQLKPVWNIDIFELPFDKVRGFQIYKSNPRVNLMIIRLEDLDRVADVAFHEFINTDKFPIINRNANEEKAYHALYRQFKRMPLPASYLDVAYNTRYARNFYTDSEIERFRTRWANPQPKDRES